MLNKYPKIGIVYLQFYHVESHIDDAVSALKKLTYPKDQIEVIIVANPHPEHGSFVRYMQETIMPLSGVEIPRVTILPQEKNTGFGLGNNIGTQKAMALGCDYVYYHNNDGFFAANALEPLVGALEEDKTIGAAQSLLLLHPETTLVNSAGDSFHYLGFGFCDQYRAPVASLNLPPVQDIDYASGAALLVRTDLIQKYGAWDGDFWMYHEDLEWSLRLRMLGFRVVLVRDSIFYHKYQFTRSITKFYWMERNRYGVMLMFFRWPTLILLAPLALLLEVGLWVFAVQGGWARERWQVYRYWLKWEHWQRWLKKRKTIQSYRTISDRSILDKAATGIYFQEKSVSGPVVRYIGNPIMKLYHVLVVKLLIWW